MKLLSRIFGKDDDRPDREASWSWPRIGILSLDVRSGQFSVEVVNTAEQVHAIKTARRVHQSDTVPVYLERELHSSRGRDAVAVMSGLQQCIGYLAEEDQARFVRVLDRVAGKGYRATCMAKIVDDLDDGNSEVLVDIHPPDEVLKLLAAQRPF